MKKYEPPDSSNTEAGATLLRAGVSAIIGGPATELINSIVNPALTRRKAQWMEEVAHGLRTLEAAGYFKLEDLQGNDDFIDAVMVASTIAMKTHNEEKRKALRNAVLNSALPESTESVMQQIFLNLIDEFTEWHLRLLEFFRSPLANITGGDSCFNQPPFTGNLTRALKDTFNELEENHEFYNLIITELYNRRLIDCDINDVQTIVGDEEISKSRTKAIGNLFLGFIAEPDALKSSEITNTVITFSLPPMPR